MNIDLLINLLLPPLVGAFIGYTTNYVAIRMLFRPLRAWRVFGIRIPFTPGIIPARRGELAAKLGRTVGGHLVTSDDAGKALEKEAFQEELRQVVKDKLTTLLDTDYQTLGSFLAGMDGHWPDELVQAGRRIGTEKLFEYLGTPDFELQLRRLLRKTEENVLACKVGDFLDDEARGMITEHIRERLCDLAASDDFSNMIGRFVEEKMQSVLDSDKTLREILPAGAVDVMFSFIRNELPPLLARVSNVLEDPVVRERLIDRLSARVGELLGSLGGWSGFLAGFVNPDRITARLPEFLDQAGQEIGEWLSEDATKEYISDQVIIRIHQVLDKPMHQLVEKLPPESVAELRCFVRDEAVQFIRSSLTARMAVSTIDAGLKRLQTQSVHALVDHALPPGSADSLVDAAVNVVLKLIQNPASKEAVGDVLEKQLALYVHEKAIGKLSHRVPLELQDQLPEILYSQLLDILRRELPPFIESLNVEKMVEDNVNSLPILEVEGILLAIMRKHFMHINLFGGALGFLIGCLNILW